MIGASGQFANDADVLGAADDLLLFEPGTVGWARAQKHFDTEDGVTLVCVTLHRGKSPATPGERGVGQGHEILCRIGGGLFRIPRKGTPVMVGFPTAYATQPGAGIIVCTTEPSPDIQFSDTRAKLDLGNDTDLVIKARTITLSDYDNRFLHIGPDGVMLQDEAGNGVVMKRGGILIYVADGGDAKTLIQLTKDELSLLQKAGSFLKLKDGNATVFATTSGAIVAGNVLLGAKATALTPVHYGPGLVPSPSTSVFVSP